MSRGLPCRLMVCRAGVALTVDAFFFAPDEASSDLLVADLRADGWEAEWHAQKEGLLRRRTTWSISASRRFDSVDLASLDEMVEVLVRRGHERGADFDGWGAEAPGEGE